MKNKVYKDSDEFVVWQDLNDYCAMRIGQARQNGKDGMANEYYKVKEEIMDKIVRF